MSSQSLTTKLSPFHKFYHDKINFFSMLKEMKDFRIYSFDH